MQHYEIVFLVHPDQSPKVPKMIQQYKSTIESSNGKVHRLENWGLRQLAYPIDKASKAHYVLMNIECTSEVRKEITDSFQFSNEVLRNLILRREQPILDPSPVKQAMEEAEAHKKATELKQSKEQDLATDDQSTATPTAKSEQKTTEQENVKDNVDTEVATATENIKPTASDTQKPEETLPT